MEISNKQISLFGEIESTSSPEDSLANRTQAPEKDSARRMIDISGRRCLEQFERLNRDGLLAKTFADLLIGMTEWYSRRCILNWKLKGTKYNRSYFQLAVLALPTEETESGLLLTPSTVDIKPNEKRKKKREEYRKSIGRKWVAGSLTEQIYHDPKWKGMLPTPVARDYKGTNSMDHLQGKNGNTITHDYQLPNYIKLKTGSNSQLNPQFVAEMMGFPPNWTILPFQNGEENQSKDMETQ